LSLIFLKVGITAKVRFFFEEEEIVLAKEVGCAEATGATADDDHIIVLRNRRPREGVAVADLVADFESVACDLSLGVIGSCEKRKIDRAAGCD
jgi:hypothetical protein